MSSQFERNGASNTYIECECGSPQHIIRMTVSDDGEDEKWEPMLLMGLQLSPGGLLFRIYNALLYIFLPRKCQWDESMLGVESVEQLEKAVIKFKRAHRLWKLKVEGVCVHCEGLGGVDACNVCGKCATCSGINEHKNDCPMVSHLIV